MTGPLVLYEVKDKIAFITLNRPEKRNALNSAILAELAAAWKRYEKDKEAWVAILSGAGKGFSSGMDQVDRDIDRRAYLEATRANGTTVFKPIVGAVHGWALGTGYSLAVKACDLTIASEETQFGYPEVKVGNAGIVPYVPYMHFKRNLEFMLTGIWIDAQKAYEWGMVNKVVPQGKHMEEAIKWAEILKKNAPLTLRAIKYGQYKGVGGLARTLDAEAEWEFEHFTVPQTESEDRKEAIQAFREKREPRFKGR
jgi:enoyl-CoA hydratase/carnithine racemase